MATEVLLMSAVPQLGDEGDVVKVADGYARNYLLPRGLAAPVNAGTRRQLARHQEKRAAELADRLAGARELANRLAGASCTIPVKTGEDEKLYGSVGAADILAALKAQDIVVDRHAIKLEHPIKELGVFDVPVELHPEVRAAVKVWVVGE